jgi:hypothetical protein
LATATAKLTGQAPAIGASRIGVCKPYRRQKAIARCRAVFDSDILCSIKNVWNDFWILADPMDRATAAD